MLEPLSNKVAGLPAFLIKNRLRHWCFHVNIAKFLRIPFLVEYLWWLLLDVAKLPKKIWTQLFLLEIFSQNQSKAHSQISETILVTESPLKMTKNAFYFSSKALSVLKIFKFLS